MTIQFLPTFPERPSNPARCNVRTGDIEINAARWAELSPEEREFVLHHEIGHYKLQTFNEVAADEYALSQLALKKPYSLINYLSAVDNISYGNSERVRQAQFDTLEIAAKHGSAEAKKLLERCNVAADGNQRVVTTGKIWIIVSVLFLIMIFIILNKQ